MDRVAEFVSNHALLCAGFLAVLTLWIFGEVSRKTRKYREIGAQEAVRFINRESAIVLDMRPETEYREGHIVSAKNLALDTLETRGPELDKSQGSPIIVYATNPQTAITACEKLVARGFQRVMTLAGGYQGWVGENYPVVRPTKRR
jgi:rhodanese-related sulfurtransferase